MADLILQRFDHDGIELINSIPRPVKALPQSKDMLVCPGKATTLSLCE